MLGDGPTQAKLVWERMEADNVRLRTELEQFDEKMECGHERRFIISAGEGTNYCAACSYEAQLAEARAENERLLNVVRSMEAKADGHYKGRHKPGRDDWLWVRAMCRDVMKEKK